MYPTLYKITKTGKVQQWCISVEKNIITRTDGHVDGKQKSSTREVSGNTLRTAEQQAQQEAETYWIKQLDKDYKPDSKDKKSMGIYNHVMKQKSMNGGMNRGVKMFGETQITSSTTDGTKIMSEQHHPMLSQKYEDHRSAVTFPVFTQPKCDGMRCLPRLENGRVVLESRNGKDYVHLNHIREELKKILKPEMVLDGELYIHHIEKEDGNPMKNVERYQFLSKACKITRSKPHEKEYLVQFWVFDIWNPHTTNHDRNRELNKIMKGYKGEIIQLLPTKTAHSHEEIEKHMEIYIADDYEGLMLRNPDAVYVSKSGYHCRDLLKYKRFEDEEWIITGAEECQGTHKGAVKWICELNGKKLVAKQVGKLEDSRDLYTQYKKSPKKFNGKYINIRFNDRTKDGIPRFPRAISFVEDKH
jgi:ATP-dependent DNA ligase